MKNQSGFTAVEGVIVVVVLAVIAVAGYVVWRHGKNATTPATTAITTPGATTISGTSYTSPAVTTPAAPQVQNATQLNSALQALNQTSISANSTDSSQLTTQSSSF